jgi:hypothetical protein
LYIVGANVWRWWCGLLLGCCGSLMGRALAARRRRRRCHQPLFGLQPKPQ